MDSWRVVEVGGPDYVKEMENLPYPIRRGGPGYICFGAARKLCIPVKEVDRPTNPICRAAAKKQSRMQKEKKLL